MSIYAIGDIQGSFDPLQRLLEKIQFDPTADTLWLAGDLVNRGPKSLQVLRFLYQIRKSVICVLGNHDLHLLAVAAGFRKQSPHDTLQEILDAEDRDLLLYWLRQQKIFHWDKQLQFAMVHAGVPPQWSLDETCRYAEEVESVLRGDGYRELLATMYGNLPAAWSPTLTGADRLRILTNYFTRMRFCSADGELELKTKTGALDPPPGYAPWFAHPHRKTKNEKIIFGHWAALEGKANTANVYALDTGCAWGGSLTALRLKDECYFRYACGRQDT